MSADLTALLMLQHAATEEQANEILDRLESPWVRERLRLEWRQLYAQQVQTIGRDR